MTRVTPKINIKIRDTPNITVIMTVGEVILTNMHIIKIKIRIREIEIRICVEKITGRTRGMIQGMAKIIPMPTIENSLGDILIITIVEIGMIQIIQCHPMEAKGIDTAMNHKWVGNNAIKIRMKTLIENKNWIQSQKQEIQKLGIRSQNLIRFQKLGRRIQNWILFRKLERKSRVDLKKCKKR